MYLSSKQDLLNVSARMNSIVLFISLGMAWLYYCLFQQKMIRLQGGKSDEE